jgi:hypothetical protein
MASKRRQRRKQCEGKRRYGTQTEALTAQCNLNRKRGWSEKLSPYRCRFCHGFHFGHTPGQKRLPHAV